MGDGVVHAVQSAQESRFAAARWADEGRHILHADIDGDVIDRLFLAIKDVDVARSHLGLLHSRGILGFRSEEHTSELQSLMRISYAVFCLKKKKNYILTP